MLQEYKKKKAVSEMVAYMFLVVIAVGLSVLVFAYLRTYVPKEQPECKEGISLVVQNYSCSVIGHNLSLTISNKGRFSVDAAYIRIAIEGKKVRSWVNKNNSEFYFVPVLAPGNKSSGIYNIVNVTQPGIIKYELEIQPALLVKDKVAACSNAIVIQSITCS